MQETPVLRNEISHNSRFPSDRYPQGALKCGEKVSLILHLSERFNDAEPILTARMDGGELRIHGARVPEGSGSRHVFCLGVPEYPGLVWYRFSVSKDGRAYHCGGRSGESGIYETDAPEFRITVYDGSMKTPEWFKDGVAYQIFPDRFNRSKDPGSFKRLSRHTAMGRSVYLHDNWNELPLYLPLPGNSDYSPCDFFGGDLKGIAEKLPYLKSLGVTCLYLNPIFESPSNHRYDTSDYHSIDPMLGDEADFAELCRKASGFGIRVMLDGVFSHTGADSVYFDLYGRYPEPGAARSRDSKYYEWYDFKNWPEEYRCWWGFKTLPEVNELTPSYIRFIEGVLEHWAKAGATNWRLDVADELPDDFMRALYRKLKSLDPEGVLLGEVWEDASNKFSMGHRRPYTDGGVLDSVMNYPFRSAVLNFLAGRTDAFGLKNELLTLREAVPKPFYDSLLNLLGSHDTERALSVLCGYTGENISREQQALIDPPAENVITGRKRLKLAVLIQFSLPGVPCVYYGDEAGAAGLSDPFNRGTYPWGKEDEDLLGFYRLVSASRGESPAMRRGLCAFAALSRDTFLAARECGQDSVIAVVNRGETEASVSVSREDLMEGEDGGKLYISGSYTDLLSGARFETSGGRLELNLGPLTGMLLSRR